MSHMTVSRMMTTGLLALALEISISTLRAQTPVVSNIVVDGVGHSSARFTWNASGCPVNSERIRFGLTTSYEAAAGGGIQRGGDLPQNNLYQLALSGLMPNLNYHVCPQSSCDGGATWSACVDTTLTTLPLRSPHPAYPKPPETFTAEYPDTTGYHVVNIANDCSDLQSSLNAAIALQPTNGTVINVPPAATCPGNYTFPVDPSAKAFAQAGVNTGTNRITINSHGFSINQSIVLSPAICGAGGYCGPAPAPLISGEVYYVINPTNDDFQLSSTPGGSAIAFSNQGNFAGGYVAPWPPSNSNWVVIRTATPDDSFVPQDVRVNGSQWAPLMAHFVIPGGTFNNGNLQFALGQMSHHIYFMGLELTNTDVSSLAATTNDPKPTYGYVTQWPDNAYIVWDRCYIHGQPTPNRLYRPIVSWAGHYVAIRNSDMPRWTYPRSSLPYRTANPYPFKTSFSGQTVTLAPGSAKLLNGKTCTAAAPITFTGSGNIGTTTTASLEIGLDCTPQVVIPNGASATCSGVVNDGSANHGCAIVTAASPNWTRDSSGGYQNFQVAQFSIANGVWSAPVDTGGQASVYVSEGTQGMIGGYGRGPYLLENNFSSGAGLLWHFDDSGGAPQNKSYVLRRNTFQTPGYTQFGGASSDGYEYMIRNGPEWKHGSQILVTGNIFDGGQAGVSSTGCALVFTGRSSQWVSDAEIVNNTFQNVSCGVSLTGGVGYADTINGAKSKPFQHGWIHNNLFNRVDGATFFDPAQRTIGAGFFLFAGYNIEDLIVDHNTAFDNRGYGGLIHLVHSPIEGVSITNNIFTINNDQGGYGISVEGTSQNTPNCDSTSAKAAMDCLFLRGAGNPSYTFANNLLAPLYTNSANLSGNLSPGSLSARYPNLNVIVPQGALPADRINSIGFYNVDENLFRLNTDSVNASGAANRGTDGLSLGADLDALEAEQGHVGNLNISPISSTGATITFLAPDSFGCPVDYSTDPDFGAFTRAPNAGGDRSQSVALTNLQGDTTYYFRVMCAVQQPASSFTTQ